MTWIQAIAAVLLIIAWLIVKSYIREIEERELLLKEREKLIDDLQRDVFDKDDAVNKYRDVLFKKAEAVKTLELIANERYEQANKILEEAKRISEES